MELLYNGILFGLTLTILVGPIFFAIIQTAIERGSKAGIILGSGVWFSDFAFILGIYFGIAYVKELTSMSGFRLYTGIIGGIILLSFGIASLLKKPSEIPHGFHPPKSWFSIWLQGFLINTFNPFTIFFWLGVVSTILIKDQLTPKDAFLFLTGLFCTVVTTDILKVLLAKRIGQWLNPQHILWLRRVSGAALIVFGFVLLYQVL